MKFLLLSALQKTAAAATWLKKAYAWTAGLASSVLAYYTDIHLAFYLFMGATVIDTLTSINAQATQKGLVFNPLKGYFWKEITSKGLRNWAKKVFGEYGVWLVVAFMINEWVLKNMIIFNMFDRKLTLPVIAIYFLSFIEIWSIGENIEKTGKKNYLKVLFEYLAPEKYRDFFKKLKEK